MKKTLWILLFFIIILFYTRGIFNSYFLQDEWGGFGIVFNLMSKPLFSWFNILGEQHFTPFGQFLWFLMYKFFGYQAQYYFVLQLLLHAIAGFLVFILTERLSNSKTVGLLTALLFVTDSRTVQAFTLLSIMPTTLTSFILILLFLIYLTTTKMQKKFTTKTLIICLCFFFIAILFREDGFLIVPLSLLYLYIFDRGKFNKKNRWFFILFLGTIFIFLLMRFFLQIINPSALNITTKRYILSYLYNVLSLPIKMIVQNIIAGNTIFTATLESYQLFYSDRTIPFFDSYPVFIDLASLIIFNILILFVLLITNIYKNKILSKIIYFSLGLVASNALLLSLVGRPLYIVDGRYLYLTSFVVLWVVSYILILIFKSNGGSKFLSWIKKGVVVAIITFVFLSSYSEIQSQIRGYVLRGGAERNILRNIIAVRPHISNNAIIYVECKTNCQENSKLGLPPSLVLPFPAGAGWVILSQYAKGKEQAYGPFFQQFNGKYFLWGEGSEGYKKIGSYGFGYFYNEDDLKKIIQKEHLNKNIVIGLEYNENNFTVSDITDQIRKEL